MSIDTDQLDSILLEQGPQLHLVAEYSTDVASFAAALTTEVVELPPPTLIVEEAAVCAGAVRKKYKRIPHHRSIKPNVPSIEAEDLASILDVFEITLPARATKAHMIGLRNLVGRAHAETMSAKQSTVLMDIIEHIVLSRFSAYLTPNEALQLPLYKKVMTEGISWAKLGQETDLGSNLDNIRKRNLYLIHKIHTLLPAPAMDTIIRHIKAKIPDDLVPERAVKKQPGSRRTQREVIHDRSAPVDLLDSFSDVDRDHSRGLSTDVLGLYLKDLGKHPLLTAQEERDLAKVIENGLNSNDPAIIKEGKLAKERFINSNLRLAFSIAKKYELPQGVGRMDLIQEGNLGLEHAVDKFDWRKGFKFSTYATYWIRQSIGRHLDQKASLIHIPGDRAAALRASVKAVDGDVSKLSQEDSDLYDISHPTSLNKYANEAGDAELGDLIANELPGPEDAFIKGEEKRNLYEAIERLDEEEATALIARLGLFDNRSHSVPEVGKLLGVTKGRARWLLTCAEANLKNDELLRKQILEVL